MTDHFSLAAHFVGESDDESELCRLLQLVLGCAVHCDRQEEFIQVLLLQLILHLNA